jgi:N-acetylneuraminic acid mutarotase
MSSCEDEQEKEIIITEVTPAAGGIGALVTIKGSGFGISLSDVQVFFNEKLAETIEVSDTMIVTRIPEAATTGTLLVNVGTAAEEWTEIFNVLNGHWTRVKDMPGPGRGYMAAFSLGGKGYITGGTDNGSHFKELYEYDPATDQWTEKAPFPGAARYKPVFFTIGDKAYVGLGSVMQGDSLEAIEMYAYDAQTDTWTKKANFPGGQSGWGLGFSIGGKGYAGKGSYLETESDFYQYDPETDTWTKLNFAPEFNASASLGFVANGFYYGGCGLASPEQWWKYNPETDQWTRLNDVPFIPKTWETAFSIDDKGYVSSGTTDIWEYDAANDSWTQKTSDPAAQITRGATSFSIGGKAYVGGGVDDFFTTKFFEFDPQ